MLLHHDKSTPAVGNKTGHLYQGPPEYLIKHSFDVNCQKIFNKLTCIRLFEAHCMYLLCKSTEMLIIFQQVLSLHCAGRLDCLLANCNKILNVGKLNIKKAHL